MNGWKILVSLDEYKAADYEFELEKLEIIPDETKRRGRGVSLTPALDGLASDVKMALGVEERRRGVV